MFAGGFVIPHNDHIVFLVFYVFQDGFRGGINGRYNHAFFFAKYVVQPFNRVRVLFKFDWMQNQIMIVI
jgi:hypothetical protein